MQSVDEKVLLGLWKLFFMAAAPAGVARLGRGRSWLLDIYVNLISRSSVNLPTPPTLSSVFIVLREQILCQPRHAAPISTVPPGH